MPRPDSDSLLRRARLAQVQPHDPNQPTGPLPPSELSALQESQDKGPWLILWDVVGSCNLRCPSCPQGTMRGANPKGFVDVDLFTRILDHLRAHVSTPQLHFYNWTEPLLHPEIGRLCHLAVERGFHLHLSSNLNHLPDPDAVMSSGMKTFRVSLSGFTQGVYARGHRGGRIEKVKENMRRLSESKTRTGARTRLHVYYLKYRDNLHEIEPMRAYAESLGFEWQEDWAYLMPLEKVFDYLEDRMPAQEKDFADSRMVPRVDSFFALGQHWGADHCLLIDQLVLDHLGNVIQCCAVFEQKDYVLGHALELNWRELQARRYRSAVCAKCHHYGCPQVFTYQSHPVLRPVAMQLVDEQLHAPPRTSADRLVALPVLGS